MPNKFTYQWIEESVEFLSDEGDYNVEYDPADVVATDSISSILAELDREVWDNIDERGDGTVICYPADSNQDYMTGKSSRNQLILKSRNSEWICKVMDIYHSKQKK